jgi:type IV pilus assembly protein PilB
MPMTDALKEMVLQGCSTAELKEQMMREGIWTLRMSGIDKACKGVTTVDEITSCTAADRIG